MFATQQFKDWAAGRVVLLELDFPRRGKPSADAAKLMQTFGVRGLPTFLLLDAELAKVGQVPFGSVKPDGWIAAADRALAKAAK